MNDISNSRTIGEGVGSDDIASSCLMAIPGARLGKYLRRELCAEWKRIFFQIKLLCIIDPACETDLHRFHILDPLNRFFQSQYGSGPVSARGGGPATGTLVGLAAAANTHRIKALRRTLKLTQRELRQDLCRAVEKTQLLRAIDPGFEAEVHKLGFARALDLVARWHAHTRPIPAQKKGINRA